MSSRITRLTQDVISQLSILYGFEYLGLACLVYLAWESEPLSAWGMAFFALGLGLRTLAQCSLLVWPKDCPTNTLYPKPLGLYSLVRHPLALSWLLSMSGLGLMTQRAYPALILLLVSSPCLLYHCHWQDQKRFAKWGSRYARYRFFTPAVIPTLSRDSLRSWRPSLQIQQGRELLANLGSLALATLLFFLQT